MKLEVLLSVMNLNKKDLKKHNITSDCVVINQCDKESVEKYKNYTIYSYNEKGASRSRNRALDKTTGDIIAFCDDDCSYYKDYDKIIIKEFKDHPEADIILFNIDSPNRYAYKNNRFKKIHFYNFMRYATSRIVFRRNSIIDKNISFNELFGPGSVYEYGDETIFLAWCIKNKLKIYASPKCIAKVGQDKSTWFNGYGDKYYYDKGAIFEEISKIINIPTKVLIIQYILRHNEYKGKYSYNKVYSLMNKGAMEYRNSNK